MRNFLHPKAFFPKALLMASANKLMSSNYRIPVQVHGNILLAVSLLAVSRFFQIPLLLQSMLW